MDSIIELARENFDKIKNLHKKADMEYCNIFHVKNKVVIEGKAAAYEAGSDFIEEHLKHYAMESLLDEATFISALNLKPWERLAITREMNFDEFLLKAILPIYRSKHLAHNLDHTLSHKKEVKSCKI